jgi:hypothetical protein
MKVLTKLSMIPAVSRYAYATSSRVAVGWGTVLHQRIGTSLGTTSSLELRRLFATLLTPVSLTAFVFAAWRLGSDLSFTKDFIIADGPLSNWMVWVAIGAAVQACANTLKRIDDQVRS